MVITPAVVALEPRVAAPRVQIDAHARRSDGAGPAPSLRHTTARIEAAIVVGLMALAFAVRIPYLMSAPRFTDESIEALHALAIYADGLRPLTGPEEYIGPLHAYLIAAVLWVAGPSPAIPRLVSLVAGVLTVAATYALARQLGGRPAGIVAGLLLSVLPLHVTVNSHVGWSSCLTPLVTTGAVLLLLRGRAGYAALGAGVATGLAIQTHPSAVALVPAIVTWLLLADGRAAWSRLVVVGIGVVGGVAPLLAFNLTSGFASVTEAWRWRAIYEDDAPVSTSGAFENVQRLLLAEARILGGD